MELVPSQIQCSGYATGHQASVTVHTRDGLRTRLDGSSILAANIAWFE